MVLYVMVVSTCWETGIPAKAPPASTLSPGTLSWYRSDSLTSPCLTGSLDVVRVYCDWALEVVHPWFYCYIGSSTFAGKVPF
jgi:hypothetical protein